MPGTIKLIKLILIDFDGCLFNAFGLGNDWERSNEPVYGGIRKWLVETNKTFFDSLATDIDQHEYNNVFLGFGTNRNCYQSNRKNEKNGGPGEPVLPIVEEQLKKRVTKNPKVILIEPFWMADIYAINGSENAIATAGDSYKRSFKAVRENKQLSKDNLPDKLKKRLSWRQKVDDSEGLKDQQQLIREFWQSKDSSLENHTVNIPEKEHPQWVFDNSKISLIYAHAHRVAMLNADADEIVIDFYDDRFEILEGIHEFFSENLNLLPNKVKLNLYQYSGGNSLKPFSQNIPKSSHSIKGTGETDRGYAWSVRFMAVKCAFFSGIELGAEQEGLQSAKALEIYHKSNRYNAPSRQMEMKIDAMRWDIKKTTALEKFQQEEQEKKLLITDAKYQQQFLTPQYLSSEELYELTKPDNPDTDLYPSPAQIQEKIDSEKVTLERLKAKYLNNQTTLDNFFQQLQQIEALWFEDEKTYAKFKKFAELIQDLQKIVSDDGWKEQGVTLFFWKKVPTAIQQMKSRQPMSLPDMANLIKAKREDLMEPLRESTRSAKTSGFYKLIVLFDEASKSSGRKLVPTLNIIMTSFCEKWKIDLANNEQKTNARRLVA